MCYLYALTLLANTGHEGGRLVHEFGVRAPVAQRASDFKDPETTQAGKPEPVEYDDD